MKPNELNQAAQDEIVQGAAFREEDPVIRGFLMGFNNLDRREKARQYITDFISNPGFCMDCGMQMKYRGAKTRHYSRTSGLPSVIMLNTAHFNLKSFCIDSRTEYLTHDQMKWDETHET